MDVGADERRFTLLDAMVLVAATAIVLAQPSTAIRLASLSYLLGDLVKVVRGIPPIRGRPLVFMLHDPEVNWALGKARGGFIPIGDMPGEITLGWALFARPGPQLSVQISEAACRVAGPILGIASLALLALRLRAPRPGRPVLLAQPGFWGCAAPLLVMACYPAILAYLGIRPDIGMDSGAVAIAWLSLGIARRWRPEPSWIDRAGRVIGLLWLSILPLRLWAAFY